MKTPAEQVKEYYPDATPLNVGCKLGNYFHIYDEKTFLGKGKSKKAAWKAVSKNISK